MDKMKRQTGTIRHIRLDSLTGWGPDARRRLPRHVSKGEGS